MTLGDPPTITWLEILATFGAFSSLIGVFADHVWARRRIDAVQRRNDNHRDVEIPVREELTRLADFGSDVVDWGANRGGQTKETLMSTGIRLSRKLNQAMVIIAKRPHTDSAVWASISTEDFDCALSVASEETKNLSVKTLSIEVDRLERRLLEALGVD